MCLCDGTYSVQIEYFECLLNKIRFRSIQALLEAFLADQTSGHELPLRFRDSESLSGESKRRTTEHDGMSISQQDPNRTQFFFVPTM